MRRAALALAAALAAALTAGGGALTGVAVSATTTTIHGPLIAGGTLTAGQQVLSPNRQYVLSMQSDGNLVERVRGGGALWVSQTSGHPGAHAVLQRGGNLVVYDASGAALWSSNSRTKHCPELLVQNDGNLVIYARRQPIWASHTVNSIVASGGTLRRGWMIYSPPPEDERLVMQKDGNLVLYDGAGKALWATNTGGHPGAWARMLTNGNLVVYAPGHTVLWASNTSKHRGAQLTLQANGNLVVSLGSAVLWTSGTSGQGSGPTLAPKAPRAATCPAATPPPAPQPAPPPPPPPSAPVVTTPVTTPVPVPPPAPAPSPSAPKKPRPLRIKLSISWTWDRATTQLRKAKVGDFPGKTRLTLGCKGRGCPRHMKKVSAWGPRGVHRLLRRLWGGHYRAGNHILISLVAPGWRTEKAEIVIRWGHLPMVKRL